MHFAAQRPSSPLTKSKRLIRGAANEPKVMEESVAARTTTTETDDELQEAFESVEKKKKVSKEDKEKSKGAEEKVRLSSTIYDRISMFSCCISSDRNSVSLYEEKRYLLK